VTDSRAPMSRATFARTLEEAHPYVQALLTVFAASMDAAPNDSARAMIPLIIVQEMAEALARGGFAEHFTDLRRVLHEAVDRGWEDGSRGG
jgi:hypothetical protein